MARYMKLANIKWRPAAAPSLPLRRMTYDHLLRDGRITDARRAEAVIQAFGPADRAGYDVFAKHNDRLVGSHLLSQGLSDRGGEIDLAHHASSTA